MGRPFFSALRFSGNSALMKALLEDKGEELERLVSSSYKQEKTVNDVEFPWQPKKSNPKNAVND